MQESNVGVTKIQKKTIEANDVYATISAKRNFKLKKTKVEMIWSKSQNYEKSKQKKKMNLLRIFFSIIFTFCDFLGAARHV